MTDKIRNGLATAGRWATFALAVGGLLVTTGARVARVETKIETITEAIKENKDKLDEGKRFTKRDGARVESESIRRDVDIGARVTRMENKIDRNQVVIEAKLDKLMTYILEKKIQ